MSVRVVESLREQILCIEARMNVVVVIFHISSLATDDERL